MGFKDMFAQDKSAPPIKNSLLMQALNVFGFIIVVVVNVMGTAGGLPQSNAVVSDKYPTKVTPDGTTFSVWGVIYFFVAAFVVYQALPSSRTNELIFKRINYIFLVTCLLNFAWTIVFTYEHLWVSAVLISGILVGLLAIYVRIGAGLRVRENSMADYWCVEVPFGLYTAWLCIAVIVNISVALTGASGWYGEPWTSSNWAVLMLTIAATLTTIVLIHRRDAAFGGVISWALFGVARQQAADELVYLATTSLGIIIAIFCGLAAGLRVYFWLQRRREVKHGNPNEVTPF